jgi:hypothetical protein
MRDVYELIAEMRESSDPVDRIVVAIWSDVTDRRGWRQEHDQFDPDIQIEIVEDWRAKVREILP